MAPFLAALRSGRVLLMDGAMGTHLQRLTQAPSFDGFEAWNLTRPELIQSVHRAYLDVGAEVLLTNTFRANPTALGRQKLAGEQQAIWRAGVQLARRAGTGAHLVLADIGPLEAVSSDVIRSLVCECGDVDGILLETWSSPVAVKQFADVLNEAGGMVAPLLVSFTFHRDNPDRALTTFAGASPEECARAAAQAGAVAVGANCGKDIGMEDMVEVVNRYRSMCDVPIFARPNAGTPVASDSGWVYPRSPGALGEGLAALLDAGIRMIGGCCGTTPEMIWAFRQQIDAWNRRAHPEA